jgi:hypothetical protein
MQRPLALTRLGLEPTAFMCVAIVLAHLGGPASRMINLGHQKFGGLFLCSSGLTRFNSIRDTVQTQHEHIPR